jgi:uncharacterized protein YqgQ
MMQTYFDVYNLLKSYGTIIYTGEKKADVALMEEEVRELYKSKLIEPKTFQQALLILRREYEKRDKR